MASRQPGQVSFLLTNVVVGRDHLPRHHNFPTESVLAVVRLDRDTIVALLGKNARGFLGWKNVAIIHILDGNEITSLLSDTKQDIAIFVIWEQPLVPFSG